MRRAAGRLRGAARRERGHAATGAGAAPVALRRLLVVALTLLIAYAAPAAPTLEVAYAGCEMVAPPAAGVRPGELACELWGPSFFEGVRGTTGGGLLTLWVKTAPGDEPAVAVDGKPAKVREKDGRRLLIEIERGSRALVVSAGRWPKRKQVRLPIVTAVDTEELSALRAAMATRDVPALEGLRLHGSPATRARATARLARVRARTDAAGALELFEQAIALDREAGLVSGEAEDSLAWAWMLIDRQRDLEGASRVLAALDRRGVLQSFPEGQAVAAHCRAFLASARGDLGEALRRDSASEALASALDLRGLLGDVYGLELDALDQIGRQDSEVRGVIERLERTPPRPDQPCSLAGHHGNVGWHLLRRAGPDAAHDSDRREADVHFEKAEEILRAGGACPDPCVLRNVLTNRAHVALDLARNDEPERHLAAAARFLARAEELCKTAPPNQVTEHAVLSGRLSLAQGNAEGARASFTAAQQRSRIAGLLHYEVAATAGLAEAAETDGAVAEALSLHREADALLGRWGAVIPLGAGKATFFDQHGDHARRYLDRLLQTPPASAPDATARARRLACVARNSMARPALSAQWTYLRARSAENRAAWWKEQGEHERQRAELTERARRVAEEGDSATGQARLEALALEGAALASRLDDAAARIAGAPPAPRCEDGAASGFAEPAEGEVVLVIHPLLDSDWVAVALTRTSATARRFSLDRATLEAIDRLEQGGKGGIPEALATALADRLLAPFEAELRAAEGAGGEPPRLRIVAASPLGAMDLQELRLPWSTGTRLGERLVVSYGLSLERPVTMGEPPDPPAPSAASAAAKPAAAAGAHSRRALVVIPDPGLTSAAANGARVRGALAGAGWDVRMLEGDAATAAAVREALQREDLALFHFFGHGHAGGLDGWASRLSLAHGESLPLADVMALERAPRLVVLASCETAKAETTSSVQGPTLAHGFLIAGAEHVIASPREIDASATDDIMKELYAIPPATLLEDPAAALRRALLAARSHAHLRGMPLPGLRALAR